ncbi:hypothetical protein BCF59_0605 [Mycoplasmopsis mustelae]|uniref:NERD domain-containing protein n=1 Tax=Mycoplasmopsis mustelae TaxID=171289 RepID=A0A4V3FNU6_9BACT|nr:nuclease-related domain-containing protein [Mycoplasmopsis mustelae]TDV23259.1 hypothetical protein BCF59_0605 [Mycoplasmopsis mustelae]
MSSSTHLILTIFFIVFFCFILISSIVWYLYWRIKIDYKQGKKGFLYEGYIWEKLQKNIDSNTFEFLKGSSYLYDGKIFETDGFLISNVFIVVIEIKFYNGILSGDANDIMLKLKKHPKSKYKLVTNPILQCQKNLNHTFKLISQQIPYASLIIIPQQSKIKITNIEDHVLFITEDQLLETLQQLRSYVNNQNPPVINKKAVKEMLMSMKIKTNKEKQKFKKIIKKGK